MARTRAASEAHGASEPAPLDIAVTILASGLTRLIAGRLGSVADQREIPPAPLELSPPRALSVPGGERSTACPAWSCVR